MGRSKCNKNFNSIDIKNLEKILSSSKSKEVKLREISQLKNGNSKLGTSYAKQMYENYINKNK